jgi:NAD-dependent SIR2 family protein deacetylase
MLLTTTNTARNEGQRWQWRITVSGEPALHMSAITMRLHPTFSPNVVALSFDGGSWSSRSFCGWGTFDVSLECHMPNGATRTIVHALSFDSPETSLSHELPQVEAMQTCEQRGLDPVLATGDATDQACSVSRAEMEALLRRDASLSPDNPRFFHGRAYPAETEPPRAVWTSAQAPRDDHGDGPAWLTATEYEDAPKVLEQKVAMLSALLRMSRKTVLYTGAGISVASGIGQAARGRAVKNARAAKGAAVWSEAEPTDTHYAAARLARAGLVHGWIQQNHDGLPQKAGVQQELMNEIHGSWFDPSNPVVKYSGSLQTELFESMASDAEDVDLVLVMGTSLSGLNADRMASRPARRSAAGGCLGFVCINLQQTPQDGEATLRINARTDEAMRMLLGCCGLAPLPDGAPSPSAALYDGVQSRVAVPYDSAGRRLPDAMVAGHARPGWMWLDLSDGARVKLTPGHNIQGAQQPGMMHIGAPGPTRMRDGSTRAPAEGYGEVSRREPASCSFVLNIEGASMRLGLWWLEAAMRGGPAKLPIVNADPSFV